MKTEYTIKCLKCGKSYTDGIMTLTDGCNEPASLRTVYTKKRISPGDRALGLYMYGDWLPLRRSIRGSSAPVSYRGEKLGEKIGVKNLCITFNGYWPERGVNMTTGTFKECEAYSVCARLPESFDQTLVVSSVGDTARAFARVCSENNIPLIVVIPERNLDVMWFTEPVNPCVKLIVAGEDSDYTDAIVLADFISGMEGFVAEGGAKNVARRDGMGTSMLSAVTTFGEIPHYYFQAIGSGTGAIAAWEANLRLIEDGRYGKRKARLYVSQNAPFTPIYDSWKRGSREFIEPDPHIARAQIGTIYAKVLSNRKPPYGIKGGLYDALLDTGGDVLKVENQEAEAAAGLFRETEGIDIAPEAAVALASLINRVKEGEIEEEALIMLNITGGGMERLRREKKLYYLKPTGRVIRKEISREKVEEVIGEITAKKEYRR